MQQNLYANIPSITFPGTSGFITEVFVSEVFHIKK